MPRSLAERIAENAARSPDGLAYATASERMTWAEYDARSTALASRCDTLIVGTWLHRDAKLDAPVDVERVRELKQRINAA